jgi:hypothetical protein
MSIVVGVNGHDTSANATDCCHSKSRVLGHHNNLCIIRGNNLILGSRLGGSETLCRSLCRRLSAMSYTIVFHLAIINAALSIMPSVGDECIADLAPKPYRKATNDI